MFVWNVLKRLQLRQLMGLAFLSLRYPLYIYPTLKATTESFRLSKKIFPKTHDKKGKANAFRHALWNAMICFECYKWRKNETRILNWAERITDKHEQLFPNEELDTMMDLHNNKVGREIFSQNDFQSVQEIVIAIQEKLRTAQQIATKDAYDNELSELIYIKNEGYVL